eukprot:Gregarina_sp_Poly_1__2080@NODE_1549_length_3866_cov_79_539352_g1008_i1_p2_GENE_NODE_1549_length_3866_cov_79_539352_g1008_i1NODE_1549_length_3866_cov_79_539352_g1008_i1_p2_ORF_typecomplete_len248_score22_72CS/PF04969_16/6_1e10Nudc_N/PF14050_6/4_7e08_NODE_1549_length_3866_cov_79_539352_g1008_i128713614
MEQEKIDDCLLEVARLSNGDIDTVFENIFSFFRRRTDLFILSGAGDRGFLPGKAEQIVLKAFHNQWRIAHEYEPEKYVRQSASVHATRKSADKSDSASELVTTPQPTTSTNRDNNAASSAIRLPSIVTKNGGTADLYHWGQTADSLQIEFPLPDKLTKNDLNIILNHEYISISIPKYRQDFARALLHPIDLSESSWHLDTIGKNRFQKSLIFDLHKKDPKLWWEALFKEDKKRYSCLDLIVRRPMSW